MKGSWIMVEQCLNELYLVQLSLVDLGDGDLGPRLFQHFLDQCGLAGADFAGNDDKAVTAPQHIVHVVLRRGMRQTRIEELGVGRQAERIGFEIEML